MISHRAAVPVAVAISLLAAASAWAAPQDLSLTFGTLPSAQGWTYTPSGSHAGASETLIFDADGTALHLNSMGQGFGVAGGGILYAINGIITNNETKRLVVSARCTAVEGSGSGQGGNAFGFTTPVGTQYAFSVTPTRLYVLVGTGFVQVGTTYDNTGYHEYTFSFTAPSTTVLRRDGVVINTNNQGFGVAGNRVFFGDGTGGANSHTMIRTLRFSQDLATAAPSTGWGRLKALYH